MAALVLLIGSWEFRRLADLTAAAGWALITLQVILHAVMYLNWDRLSNEAPVVLGLACITWILLFLRMRGFDDKQVVSTSYRALSFASALVAISSCWFALSWLRDQAHGEFLIFMLLIIIWAADIGAYFGGRQFGKTRLAPSISPNKTWEGVIGGVLLASFASIVLNFLAPAPGTHIGTILLLTAVTVPASICGDLFISFHKRTVKIKDAGNLFPGHGGVLDRFDSLLPGATFFAMTYWFLNS